MFHRSCSHRATLAFLLVAVRTAHAVPTQASTPGLIRCPDAAAIIASETVTKLRATPPKEAFDKVVKVAAITSSPLTAMKAGTPTNSVGAGQACALRHVVVRPGDTAFHIAQTEMGDGNLWPKLIAANPDQHGSPVVFAGSTLTIPCMGAGSAQAPVAASPAGASIAAATQSALAANAPPRTATAVQPPAAAASVAVHTVATKPAAPPPPPLPVWTARSGEYVTTVVRRWARAAHYSVIVATTADWKLAVPFRDVGTFEEALKQLVVGFQTTGAPPYIQLFPNNVLKIGGGM